ncbi:MAG: DUF1499 domain-containing protein, partial [Rhodospirillaceae bacterium]|nr:DUF1499 domain-containing protein [Rhodospirillaceae bacterium]
ERLGRLLCCFCLLTAGCAAETDMVDFADLKRSDSPNDALACPPNACTTHSDFVTDPIEIAPEALARHVIAVLSREPRTELVTRDATGLRLVFVQRSRLFGFPDTINVAILPEAEARSGLALYSRSTYGHGDLGVNRARTQDWLNKLGIGYTALE